MRTLSGPFLVNGARFGTATLLTSKYLFVGATEQDYIVPIPPTVVASVGAVYQYSTKDWSLVRTYYSSQPHTSAEFGAALAADSKRVAIGSPKDDTLASNAGKVEVFDIKTGQPVSTLSSPTPSTEEQFGTSLLFMKGNRLAVGAPAPLVSSNDGHVYVNQLN
jgi:hypothetical protein